MDVNGGRGGSSTLLSEEEMDLRRGPWTVEEDLTLINYIATHGEGRWNSLARCAGLKRTGKSCRLRWLNYLRPDVRRGNITLEEQLLILELHSRWGNRWSKIAQHLPGRTDNEIKNYWRTRVQKHAKQLKCDVNSKQFKDTMRYLWMPRLVERIQAAATTTTANSGSSQAAVDASADHFGGGSDILAGSAAAVHQMGAAADFYGGQVSAGYTPENSSTAASSADSFGAQVSPVSDLTEIYNFPAGDNQNQYQNQNQNQNQNHPDYFQACQVGYTDSLISPVGYFNPGLDFQSMVPNTQWFDGNDTAAAADNLWNVEDFWSVHPQFINNNI